MGTITEENGGEIPATRVNVTITWPCHHGCQLKLSLTSQQNDACTTAKFLFENIFTRYGLLLEIVSNQEVHFVNEVIEFLLVEFMVIHKRSTPYHPQANGLAESTNKTPCTKLTKVVSSSRSD